MNWAVPRKPARDRTARCQKRGPCTSLGGPLVRSGFSRCRGRLIGTTSKAASPYQAGGLRLA